MIPSVDLLVDSVLRSALAFLLALPLGWERDQRSAAGGLRTFPLLSVCVCGFLLIAERVIEDPSDQADVYFGVLSGIGFVGSGAIVKSPQGIVGLNAAVSLWVTGAIGAGVALGSPWVAAALAAMSGVGMWRASRRGAGG